MVYRDPTPLDPNKDYTAEELAKFILEKMYGEHTREAMARSLLKANEVAEWAREVAQQLIDGSFDEGALNTAIEQKLNDLETEYAPQLTNIKNEVEDARGNQASLAGRLDATDSQLAQTRDDLEYKINEDVQDLESNINQELNDVVKHRPIHVGTSQPSNSIGGEGSLYLQTYAEGEIPFYEEGLFTPEIKKRTHEGVVSDIENISYTTQTGNYVRVGSLVTVFIEIRLSNKGVGDNEQIAFYGIPYRPKFGQVIPIAGNINGLALENENDVITSIGISNNANYFTAQFYRNRNIMITQVLRVDQLSDSFRFRTSFTYSAGNTEALPLTKVTT